MVISEIPSDTHVFVFRKSKMIFKKYSQHDNHSVSQYGGLSCIFLIFRNWLSPCDDDDDDDNNSAVLKREYHHLTP